MDKQCQIWISGNVQGVYFRESTRNVAERLSITGFIRNLPDGRVEALFQGDPENLNEMLTWCKSGPAAARVDDIEIDWQNIGGKLSSFKVRRD